MGRSGVPGYRRPIVKFGSIWPGKSLEKHRKMEEILGKPWENGGNPGKTIGKLRKSLEGLIIRDNPLVNCYIINKKGSNLW